MALTKKKRDIVKMLINDNSIDDISEEELIDLLFNEPLNIDIDKNMKKEETVLDRLADKITNIAGSWGFIFSFVLILASWMIINVLLDKLPTSEAFDPYPFILLNLFLSCVAALQAPIIMMSQNRSAKRDSLRTKNDYKTDLKSELMLEALHEEIKKLNANQNKILKILENNNIKWGDI